MTMNADEMLENRSRTKSRFAFGWQMARTRRTSPECGPRRHHCGGDGRSTGTPACSVGGRSRDLHGPCDMTTTAANLRRLQDAISNLLRFEWQARLRHRRPSPSRIGGRQYGDSNIPTFSRIASAFLRTQSSSNGNYVMKHVDLTAYRSPPLRCRLATSWRQRLASISDPISGGSSAGRIPQEQQGRWRSDERNHAGVCHHGRGGIAS